MLWSKTKKIMYTAVNPNVTIIYKSTTVVMKSLGIVLIPGVGNRQFLIRYFYCHFRWRFQVGIGRYTIRIVYLSVVYLQVPAKVTAKVTN